MQEQMRQGYSQSFYDVLKNGEAKGLNWKEAELISIALDSLVNDQDKEEQRIYAAAGMKMTKGVVNFRSGKMEYQMSFDKMLYIPSEGGWFGGAFEEVIRKGEEFETRGPITGTRLRQSRYRVQ